MSLYSCMGLRLGQRDSSKPLSTQRPSLCISHINHRSQMRTALSTWKEILSRLLSLKKGCLLIARVEGAYNDSQLDQTRISEYSGRKTAQHYMTLSKQCSAGIVTGPRAGMSRSRNKSETGVGTLLAKSVNRYPMQNGFWSNKLEKYCKLNHPFEHSHFT